MMRQIIPRIIATIVTTFMAAAVRKINIIMIYHSIAKRKDRNYMKIQNIKRIQINKNLFMLVTIAAAIKGVIGVNLATLTSI